MELNIEIGSALTREEMGNSPYGWGSYARAFEVRLTEVDDGCRTRLYATFFKVVPFLLGMIAANLVP